MEGFFFLVLVASGGVLWGCQRLCWEWWYVHH